MSHAIQCDSCRRIMCPNPISADREYHEVWIDQMDMFHLCRDCYDGVMRDVFHFRYNADEQRYERDKAVKRRE